MASRAVLQQNAPPTETQVHDNLVAGLSRVAAQIGRGKLADNSGRTTRSLDFLFSGETGMPTFKGGLDFLLADVTALDEVLALYGVSICRRKVASANDMQTLADMAAALSKFADILSDGARNHVETLSVATVLRPLLPKLTAIVAEADELRGVAA